MNFQTSAQRLAYRAKLGVLTAVVAVCVTSSASAGIITASYTGTVVSTLANGSNPETSDDINDKFGVNGGSLLGLQATVSYSFDSDLAMFGPYQNGPFQQAGYTLNDLEGFFQMGITINGESLTITTVGGSPNNFLRYTQGAAFGVDAFDPGTGTSLVPGPGGQAFLNDAFFSFQDIVTQAGQDQFSAGVTGIQLALNSYQYINIGNVQSASSPVPEPATVALMFAPLAVAFVARKRMKA